MMKSYAVAMVALICLTFFLSGASADDHTHTYKEKEEVTVWVNRVGPYHNPQETYDYFSLPFCQPKGKVIRHKENSLGVVLEGDELSDSGIHIKYLRTSFVHLRSRRAVNRFCLFPFLSAHLTIISSPPSPLSLPSHNRKRRR